MSKVKNGASTGRSAVRRSPDTGIKGGRFSLAAVEECLSRSRTQTIIVALFFALVWGLLGFYESALLQRIEGLSLFLYDKVFFDATLAVPAGMLSYIGSFLNQFFHYPLLGATIYVALLFLAYWLVRKTFAVPTRFALMALLPVVALLATDTLLGYWIFYLKVQGYFYMALLGTIFSLLAVWAYRKSGGVWRLLFLVVWACVAYPLMGVYGLASVVLMAAVGVAQGVGKGEKVWIVLLQALFALLLVAFVPQIYYNIYDTVGYGDMYMVGLPLAQWNAENVKDVEFEGTSFWHSIYVYWVPFAMLALSCLGLSLAHLLKRCSLLSKKGVIFVPYAFFVLAMLFAVRYWYCDKNFRIENKQFIAMEKGEWRRVVDYAAEADVPTRQVVLNRNLALMKLGRAGYEMFSYPDGGTLPVSPIAIHMTHTDGHVLYYHYGRFNYCYRWCMENSVEYGWKHQYLKDAARSMLLSGEYRLAQRYLNILKSTLFYREWAVEMEKYVKNPALIGKEPVFAQPLQFACDNDFIGVDEGVEMHLTTSINSVKESENKNFGFIKSMRDVLVSGDYDTFAAACAAHSDISPVYIESTLMTTLIKKDAKSFWEALNGYINYYQATAGANAPKQLPRHYQEALLLFKTLDGGKTVEIDEDFLNTFVSRGPVGVEANYIRFQNSVARVRDGIKKTYPNITEERLNGMMAPLFKEEYGDTYFYYYFFVKKIKTY